MTDKRVARTRQALQGALLELMVECGYERLTVQQILDRAGVGRATFYLHFRSKEELLRSSFDRLRKHLGQDWLGSTEGKATEWTPLGFSLALFQHVDGHRKLYKAVVGRESGVIVERQMRRLLADLVRKNIELQDCRDRTDMMVDLAAQYITGALMAIITWWLDHSVKLSADQIDRMFRQLTLPALQAIRDPAAAGTGEHKPGRPTPRLAESQRKLPQRRVS